MPLLQWQSTLRLASPEAWHRGKQHGRGRACHTCYGSACSADFHQAVQITFTVICTLLAAAVYFLDVHTGNISRIFAVPVVTWLIIAASIFPTVRFCGYFVDVVMRVMELAFSRVENIHYVLIGTSRGLRHALSHHRLSTSGMLHRR